jgi:hypothetical protein
MRYRVAALGVAALVGFAGLGASLAAAEATSAPAPGTVRGQVYERGYVGLLSRLGNVTLQVRSHGALVTTSYVTSNGRFELALPPGTYDLGALRRRQCTGKVVVHSKKLSTLKVVCGPTGTAGLVADPTQ